MDRRPVRLTPQARAAIRETSQRAHPDEGCGYLIGTPGSRGIIEARPTRNVHPGPRTSRYLVDPLEFMEVEDRLERQGHAILGIYHSHPASPAIPSATDLASALPGLYYLVHDVRQSAAGPMRLWLLGPEGDRFTEIPLEED